MAAAMFFFDFPPLSSTPTVGLRGNSAKMPRDKPRGPVARFVPIARFGQIPMRDSL
jgi:hypothetical protein